MEQNQKEKQPTLYVMLGLPGAGKSTYVDARLVPQGVQVICPDDLRAAHGHRFYGPLEQQIHGMAYTFARAHMLRGLDVVVDECTVRASYVKRWKRLAEDMGYALKVIHLTTDHTVCTERRRENTPDFPLEIISMKESSLKLNMPDILACLGPDEYMEV